MEENRERATKLRCVKCNFKFKRSLSPRDNVSEMECPNCKAKYRVEIDL